MHTGRSTATRKSASPQPAGRRSGRAGGKRVWVVDSDVCAWCRPAGLTLAGVHSTLTGGDR